VWLLGAASRASCEITATTMCYKGPKAVWLESKSIYKIRLKANNRTAGGMVFEFFGHIFQTKVVLDPIWILTKFGHFPLLWLKTER